MTGVPFSLDGEGHVLASWMSRNKAYWSISDAGATRFGPRIGAPTQADKAIHPLVVPNHRGQVLLVWKEGTRVQWAKYDRRGRFTGAHGTAGETDARSKPLAFVGKDDRFHIVL